MDSDVKTSTIQTSHAVFHYIIPLNIVEYSHRDAHRTTPLSQGTDGTRASNDAYAERESGISVPYIEEPTQPSLPFQLPKRGGIHGISRRKQDKLFREETL